MEGTMGKSFPPTNMSESGGNILIAEIFATLHMFEKIMVIVLLTINVAISLVFKLLVIKLSRKIGSLSNNPLNGMILIDEFEKLMGCLSCTSR